MTINIAPGQTICLGFQTENEVETVCFDKSAWVTQYGPGTFELVHRRRQDTEALPIAVDVDGGIVIWTITAADVAYRGRGEAQLRYYNAHGQIKASEIYETQVARSLTSDENVPEPYEGWVAEVLQAGADAQLAQTGAEAAQAAAELAQGKAEDAQEAAERAQTAAETAQGLAEAAQTAAEGAQTAAETAQGKAEDAQEAAEAAQTAAETAQGKAEDAQEAAETAQTAAETAQGKAEDAQTAAEASAAAAAESARTLTIDPTLTQSGQAADAQVTGDRFDFVNENLAPGVYDVLGVYDAAKLNLNKTINIATGDLGNSNGRTTTGLLNASVTAKAFSISLSGYQLRIYYYHYESETLTYDGYDETFYPCDGTIRYPSNADTYKLVFYHDPIDTEAMTGDESVAIAAALTLYDYAENKIRAQIAPEFSESAEYAAGEYTARDGSLYVFTTQHTAGAWTGSDAAKVNIGTELEETKNALRRNAVIPGDNLISGADITASTGDVTYSVDGETGAITIVNGSTGEYANARTSDAFVYLNLVPGATYRLYASAEVLSGSPKLVLGVRGTSTSDTGVAARADITDHLFGFLDFTADEYMKSVAVYLAWGSSTRYSSLILRKFTLKRLDVSGADAYASRTASQLVAGIEGSILSPSDISETVSGVTVSVDQETGDITVTNASSSTTANAYTPDSFFTGKLTVGAVYRLHAKARALSGRPNLSVAIRGVSGNAQGISKRLSLNAEAPEGYIDFIADKYMQRVTLFMANGSSTKNSSAVFSGVWLKKIKDPVPYITPPFFSLNKPLFRAHNGDEQNAPSASMPAFRLACEKGYKCIQIARVRQSADGTWYVMHNSSINDTTNGEGAIASLTDATLATYHIDVGANVEQYTDEELHIPKLSEVLALCREYGVYPSIRFGSLPSSAVSASNLAKWESLFAEVEKFNPYLCLFSGTFEEVRTLKKLRPTWYGEIYDDHALNVDSYLTQCVAMGWTGICFMSEYYNGEDTDSAKNIVSRIPTIHAAGYQVAVYPGSSAGPDSGATPWTDADVLAAVDQGIDIYQDTGKRPDVPIEALNRM